jgi:hypothetical protein
MIWYWVVLIGIGCLCLGWGICVMLVAGKVADLEFQLMLERRNKDHWKSKVKEQQ